MNIDVILQRLSELGISVKYDFATAGPIVSYSGHYMYVPFDDSQTDEFIEAVVEMVRKIDTPPECELCDTKLIEVWGVDRSEDNIRIYCGICRNCGLVHSKPLVLIEDKQVKE